MTSFNVDGSAAKQILPILVEKSCWFSVDPLPDAQWQISVKPEQAKYMQGLVQKYQPKRPRQLLDPDFTKLIDLLEQGTKEMEAKGYQDVDFERYVYEKAIEAVYGVSYWAWYKRKVQGSG